MRPIQRWALVAGLSLALPLLAGEPSEKFTEFDVPGAAATQPVWIDVLGVVFGNYFDSNGGVHPFVRAADGTLTTYDVPGAFFCQLPEVQGVSPNYLQAANVFGLTSGLYFDSADCVAHGWVRDAKGKVTTFDAPGAGTVPGSGTEANSLNLFGLLAGDYADSNGIYHGYLRTPGGRLITFDAPGAGTQVGGQGTVANGVTGLNNSGELSGLVTDSNSVTHAYVRSSDGKITVYDAPGAGTVGGLGTFSSSINAEGAVTGQVLDSNSNSHGYTRDCDGKVTTFDVPGAAQTFPTTNNDLGEIVGFDVDAQGNYHGFIRTPAGKFSTYDAPGSLGTLFLANNVEGSITGWFYDTNGVHGFILRR